MKRRTSILTALLTAAVLTAGTGAQTVFTPQSVFAEETSQAEKTDSADILQADVSENQAEISTEGALSENEADEIQAKNAGNKEDAETPDASRAGSANAQTDDKAPDTSRAESSNVQAEDEATIASRAGSANAQTDDEAGASETDGTPAEENAEDPTVSAGVSAPNVTYRSVAEIKAFVHAHPVIYLSPAYTQRPSTSSPYSSGSLSAKTQQDALNALNQVRYIAGLSSDITINNSYASMAQAASLVNAVNRSMSHYPTQPSGMNSSLYSLGYEGAGSSNLGVGYGNLARDLFFGWMNDSPTNGTSPIEDVGHRRWCLNPPMRQTGFGYVNRYSAMYAVDNWETPTTQDSMWPAQNTPYQYMPNYYIWSFSTGYDESYDSVHVQLRNLDTGAVWNFSSSENTNDFAVSNEGYGQSGCIMFRPEGVDYSRCEHYQVTISGTTRGTIQYPVTFFDLPEEEYNSFKDVSYSAFYHDAVYWARAAGITSGTTRTTYSPNDPCTRGQMAAFLWRISGSPSVTVTGQFRDVSASSPFASAIAWAKQSGITSGTSASAFSPDTPCTRAQMVTFLWHMAGNPSATPTSAFTDVPSNTWYAQAVAWALSQGITSGTTATTFSPDQPCTRGQMAVFLYAYKGG